MSKPLVRVVAEARSEVRRLESLQRKLEAKLSSSGRDEKSVKALKRELKSVNKKLPDRREQLNRLEQLNSARIAEAAALRRKRI